MLYPLIVWAFLCLQQVSGKNVLVYSTTIGHSHVKFHNKLADLLVDAGHKVVILLSEQNPNIKIGETKAEVITVPASEETIAIQDAGEKATLVGFWTSDIHDLSSAISVFNEISNMATSQCRKTLAFPGLFDRLKQHEFDVALSESWDLCGFGLFYQLGITKYAVTMTNHLEEGAAAILGVPNALSWVPAVEMGTTPKMSFMERIQNLRAAHISHEIYDLLINNMQSIFDAKYEEFASFRDLLANSSLIFTNSDPLIDFPRPTLHKVIDLGGITVPPRFNNLTSDWEKILSRRSRTVLVSFGTVAKAFAMPDDYKKGIMGAMDEFPDVTFIMKYERPEDGLDGERKNVVLTRWMPQNELLGDDRVVALITHCGAASMHEAAARAIPVVAIPLFHDQMRNARLIENAGFGFSFDKMKLGDKGALAEAIREVIDTKKYKKRADEVSGMIQNRPFTSEELFVKNVEFLAAHGPLKNLDPYSRKMGWLEYYNADIVLAAFGGIVFILIAFALCLCLVCFFIQQRRTKYRRCDDPDDYFLHS
ncbi:unnamed protein product, partial [Mesorhabditis belari]|uniref:glucuronosyltransferase n=1 Tax=Mesorhabditis belari TaxID=2138241 RepID=A0AAF3FBM7_9BILA